ncbi:MAG: hypothetical protein ACRCSQ_05485 [Bacteroidales bacterium]
MKNNFYFFSVRHWRVISVFLFLVIVLSGFAGEKVALQDGAGWDGVAYREMARSFSDDIMDDVYNGYNIQRIAPFALINMVYRVFGLPVDNDSLMIGVIVLQIMTLCMSVFVYYKISEVLKFNVATEIIGFSFLFFNYTCLKYVEYYPFLTDVFALFISLLLFLCFIKKNKTGMFLCSLIGAFVWPTLLGIGLCLTFLPANPFDLNNRTKVLSRNGVYFLRLIRIGAILITPVLLGAIYLLSRYVKGHASLRELYWSTDYGTVWLLLLSLVSVSFFLYLFISTFRFDVKDLFEKIKTEMSWRIIGGIGFGFLLVKMVIWTYANDSEAWGISRMVLHTVLRSVTAPGVFLENHFVFFGLVPVFMILFWPSVLKEIGKYGMAYWLILAEFVFLLTNSESRYLIYLLPFFVFPLLLVLNRQMNMQRIVVPIFVFSLIKSMFWFKINVDGIEDTFLAADYLSFPAQRYFMMHGPWQRHDMYVFFMLLAILVFIICRYAVSNILVKKKATTP